MSVRFSVSDNLFPGALIAAAGAAWPAPSWPGWYCYESAGQTGKRASADAKTIPQPCRDLLGLMALKRPAPLPSDCVPDLSLYGGGLHALPAGVPLGKHLDADRHALYGLGRVASMVLFLQPWQFDMGGRLQFWDASGKEIEAEISPAPGRLVTFLCDDGAYHSVTPPAKERHSLALFFYGPPRPSVRPRALFDTMAPS